MKKIKLMLLSLSILAVVGGALAFTAKEGTFYCTALPEDGICPQDCPVSASIKAPVLATDFVCTTPTITNGLDNCHKLSGAAVRCGASIHKTVE